MAQTEQTEDATAVPAVTIEPLVIEVRTLAISGKRVKAALLRQFVDEDLIDPEPPALRGRPLVWHALHDKHCAALPPHMHVLWQKGAVYRSALVLQDWEQDERYAQRMAALEKRLYDLCDLLALILAQDHRYETEPITIDGTARDRDHRRELAIADYTLSLSPNACYHLRNLQQARRQRDHDVQAVPEEGRDAALQQAHDVLRQLYEQGVVLGHPTLDSDIDDETLLPIPLKGFGGDYGLGVAHEREDVDEATALLADFVGDAQKSVAESRRQVRWDWRRERGGSGDTTAIKKLLYTHESALLAVIADLIVQQRLGEVQKAAGSLARTLGVEPTEQKPRMALEGGLAPLAFSARTIWKLYQEDDRHLDEYQGSCARLHAQILALDQVFIDV